MKECDILKAKRNYFSQMESQRRNMQRRSGKDTSEFVKRVFNPDDIEFWTEERVNTAIEFYKKKKIYNREFNRRKYALPFRKKVQLEKENYTIEELKKIIKEAL